MKQIFFFAENSNDKNNSVFGKLMLGNIFAGTSGKIIFIYIFLQHGHH